VWRQVVATTNAAPADLLPALRDRLHPAVLIDVPHTRAFDLLPADLRVAARNAVMAAGENGERDETHALRAWLVFARLRESLQTAGMAPTRALTLASAAVWADRATAVVDAIRLTLAGDEA
jgi:hypothetical protein